MEYSTDNPSSKMNKQEETSIKALANQVIVGVVTSLIISLLVGFIQMTAIKEVILVELEHLKQDVYQLKVGDRDMAREYVTKRELEIYLKDLTEDMREIMLELKEERNVNKSRGVK